MIPDEMGKSFLDTQAVYALTPAAAERALFYLERTDSARAFILASALAGKTLAGEFKARVEVIAGGTFGKTVAANWKRFDAHLFIMATGIVVRQIARHLEHKTLDPAVVVCDEKGEFAISLLSGHIGGANRLARRVAGVFGGRAVITTATDVQGLPAIDEIAAHNGFTILNPEAIKAINSLVLARRAVGIAGPGFWTKLLADEFAGRAVVLSAGAERKGELDLAGIILVDRDAGELAPGYSALPVLGLKSPRLIAGIGCRRGVPAKEIETAFMKVLKTCGLFPEQVAGLASIDLKKDEAGLLALAQKYSLPLFFYLAPELEKVVVPSPSLRVAEATGSSSVCEAAAILAGGGRLVQPKTKFSRVTVALAIKLERDQARYGK